jgi:hypothetical protein
MDLLWHGVTQMIHRRHAAIDGAACSSMADDLGDRGAALLSDPFLNSPMIFDM